MTIVNVILGSCAAIYFVIAGVGAAYYMEIKKIEKEASKFQFELDEMKARCPFL